MKERIQPCKFIACSPTELSGHLGQHSPMGLSWAYFVSLAPISRSSPFTPSCPNPSHECSREWVSFQTATSLTPSHLAHHPPTQHFVHSTSIPCVFSKSRGTEQLWDSCTLKGQDMISPKKLLSILLFCIELSCPQPTLIETESQVVPWACIPIGLLGMARSPRSSSTLLRVKSPFILGQYLTLG